MEIGAYCLNVGQANCLVLLDPLPEGEGAPNTFQAALIDVGVDGHAVADWLDRMGVHRIVLIALTHNDEDHIRGLLEVVVAYQGRIEQLRFVPDRPTSDIPFWIDAQRWRHNGWVRSVDQLSAPSAATPDMGAILVGPPTTTYRLHCAYPDMFQHQAVVHRAKQVGPRTGRGPNATSAVLRLARPSRSEHTVMLFGGDLDFPGWRSMLQTRHRLVADVFVLPHHGGPRWPRADFSYTELARAVKPRSAIVSVGTRQRGSVIPTRRSCKRFVPRGLPYSAPR
jgi:competence protein ComEC